MISVNSFSYTYPGTDLPALRDISLRIDAGEAVLVRGASGSGKTTLLYCLNGLIPHVFNGSLDGTVRLNGLDPAERPLREIAQTVGTVFQNPESQIFMMRVEDDVAFGCENLCLSREEIASRLEDALLFMGLSELRKQETFKLSGGYKQRLAISSIYAMQPDVFIFDEPTTDLDAEGRKDFFRIIRGLREKGKTVILAEHRYEDYLPLMDRIVTLDKGQITGHAVPAENLPSLRKTGSLRTPPVISLKHAGFSYNNGPNILDNVDIIIRQGDFTAVCGGNGSGKTTLLKIMGGILKPVRGEINILNIRKPALEALIGRVGFLFQNPDEQLFANSVEGEIAFGPKCLKKEADIGKYLEIAGLQAERLRHPQTLSRGQRQILAVVAVMAMEPEIIILDEPTTGLDDGTWHRLIHVLHDYCGKGGTVVFSTHNENAADLAGRKITINGGRIVDDEIRG